MIELPPLVLVSGKGGVGKSAVAGGIAIAAHRNGARVLVTAMGPGTGLANHLGVGELGTSPVEIEDGLSALRVDRSRALAEYLEIQVGLPSVIAFGPALRAFDALASAAPGVREVVTMGKVLWEVRRGAWDLVVADAPPTGQIASYLRAPRTISELVPAGRIREQAAWMGEILEDVARSRLILTTLAEELPTSETLETLEWLDSQGVMGRTEVVTNRILPELDLEDPGSLPSGRAGDAARLHLSLWEEQQRWLDVLPADHSIPFYFGLMTSSEVSARMADEVEAWEPAR